MTLKKMTGPAVLVLAAAVLFESFALAYTEAHAAAEAEASAAVSINGTDLHSSDYKGIGFETDAEIPGTLGIKTASVTALPEGGIGVTYTFNIQECGYYRLRLTASLHTYPMYLSSYAVSVNGGEFITVNSQNAGSSEEPDGGFGASSLMGVYNTNLVYFLNKGENTFSFYISSLRSTDGRGYAFIEKAEFLSVTPTGEVIYKLSPEKPLGVFTEEDSIEFSSDEAGIISYCVKDYFGNTAASGSSDENGSIILNPLTSGHYTLYTDKGGIAQFSVVRAPQSRRNNDNSPFASDYASVFLIDEAEADSYARAVYLAGIKQVRERMRWGVFNPAEGQYSYDEHDLFYNALKKYGIKIHSVFHSAPAYAKKDTITLADDLFAAYDFAKNAAQHYYGTVNSWEIWNEPDIGFTDSTEQADKYASLLKAMAIGYRDSGADVNISLAGLAYEPGIYASNLMCNDILKYFDTYNYHVHRTADLNVNTLKYPQNSAAHNNFIEEYGLSRKPVWVTEAGVFIPYDSGAVDLTAEQQMVSARYLATSAVEGLSRGEDKHFWFIFPYYAENSRSLGSFSSKGTPYASYNAAAAVSDAIGNGVYEGRIKGLPDGVNGYTFIDGNEAVAAIWSESETEAELITNTEAAQITNIMGERTDVLADNGIVSIVSGPDIQFIRISGNFPAQLTEKATKQEKQQRSEELTASDRIVISQTYPKNVRTGAKNGGYKLDKNSNTTVTVDVYNFNGVRMAAQISAESFGGWSISPQTKNIVIDANSKTTLTFNITSDGTPTNRTVYPVVFGGLTAYGEITDSVSFIVSDEETEVIPERTVDDYTDVSGWKRNIAGGAEQVVTYDGDKLVLSFDFPESVTDKWAYPFLNFKNMQDYSAYDGIVVNVDCDENTAGAVFRMFLSEKSGSAYYTAVGYELNAGRQQILIPWSSFTLYGGSDDNSELDTNEIISMRVGLNTTRAGISTLNISTIGLYNAVDKESEGKFVSLSYKNGIVRGVLSDSEIAYEAETAAVVADGVTYNAELNGNEFICALPLTVGTYTFLARVENESGAVIKKRITINAESKGFTGGSIMFTDENESAVYTINNHKTVNAAIDIVNCTDSPNTFLFAAAVYDDTDKLIRVLAKRYTPEAGSGQRAELSINTDGGAYIKTFLWDSNQSVVFDTELIN